MTPTEYWKQRCMAAEDVIEEIKDIALFDDRVAIRPNNSFHKKWQQLVNTPEPELELPSDEAIRNLATQTFHETTRSTNTYGDGENKPKTFGFISGAFWMREQIKSKI